MSFNTEARGCISARSILYNTLFEPALTLEVPSANALRVLFDTKSDSDGDRLAQRLHEHLIHERLRVRKHVLSRIERFEIQPLLQEKATKGARQRARASDHTGQTERLSRLEARARVQMLEAELQEDCRALDDRIRTLQIDLRKPIDNRARKT